MVFGVIDLDGGRSLKWLEGKQTAEKYCETLREAIIENEDFDKNINIF